MKRIEIMAKMQEENVAEEINIEYEKKRRCRNETDTSDR